MRRGAQLFALLCLVAATLVPAAAAGLRAARIEPGNVIVPGDAIVSVEDKPVDTASKLQARLDDFNPGDRVRLGIVRGGKRMSVEAVLAAGR